MPVELDSRLTNGFQVQMGREIAAALTYKQMAYDFSFQAWLGFEKWALEQEKEELVHSCDFGYFLIERGVRPYYENAQIGPVLLQTPLGYFEQALGLERLYWKYIDELFSLAIDVDDHDACAFLKKKVEQQHESVSQLMTIATAVRRAGDDISALLQLDEHILEIK